MTERGRQHTLKEIAHWLGSYRAEVADPDALLFELFQEPQYLGRLLGSSPCVLEGGRGSGKTTVLRGMSYEGQFFAAGASLDTFADWEYVGVYYKMDANRVTAFAGPELDDAAWRRMFGHFANLILIDGLLSFCAWYGEQTRAPLSLDTAACRLVGRELGLAEPVTDLPQLMGAVVDALVDLEVAICNVKESERPRLSVPGAPVTRLVAALRRCPPLAGKRFDFLIDEYENLAPDQQRCFNTLIKQAGGGHTFKLGVRELGWREKSTLVHKEFLRDPDDYATVNITAEFLRHGTFEDFARRVVKGRLVHMTVQEPMPRLEDLLPRLTEDEEARLQGVEPIVRRRTTQLRDRLTAAELEGLALLPYLERYLIFHWADTRPPSAADVADSAAALIRDRLSADPADDWTGRYRNYKHALLYTLVEGKGDSHRKLYAGWGTFVNLAYGNIRYLLELVEDALSSHVRSDGSLGDAVPPGVQTDAAWRVGHKNVEELVGEQEHGAALSQLTRNLGRLLGSLAAGGAHHMPEPTCFVVGTGGGEERAAAQELLDAGIRNNALVRVAGTKLQDRAELRRPEYRLHPIFSAYLTISWRHKRRLVLSPREILDLSAGDQRAHAAIRQRLPRGGGAADAGQLDLLGEDAPDRA